MIDRESPPFFDLSEFLRMLDLLDFHIVDIRERTLEAFMGTIL